MGKPIPVGAWPRGLDADQAAAYVGVGRTKFLKEVTQGLWPEPEVRGGRKIWDRVLLDRAYDKRSGLKEAGEEEQKALRAIDEYRKTALRHKTSK